MKIDEIIGMIWERPEIAKYITMEMLFSPDMIALFADITARHFHDRKDTIKFLSAKWANSERLSQDVLSGTFKAEYYKHVIINERGKQRDITPPTFETKIIQKIICTIVLRHQLEADMIKTSYATVKGRGTDIMYKDITEKLNECKAKGYKYIVLTDFSNYFNSIPRERVRTDIFEKFSKDERLVKLMMGFIPEGSGLVLGNEISQLPASYYVTSHDKCVTEEMKIPYFRYMDDTLAICKNKRQVKEYLEIFYRNTKNLGLSYKQEKIKVYGMGADFVFCKERFLNNRKTGQYYQMINPKRIRTQKRKMKAIRDFDELEKQYRSVRGSIKNHPNTGKIINKLDRLYEDKKEEISSNQQ